MWSLILVLSECFLNGRGLGHVSNFYIVDLQNFATASRRYTDDIHNSSVVGLFMTPIRQWKRLDRVMVECTCLLHVIPFNFITSICSGLVVQVVSALLRGNWQDFNWHDASRGPSAIVELFVRLKVHGPYCYAPLRSHEKYMGPSRTWAKLHENLTSLQLRIPCQPVRGKQPV